MKHRKVGFVWESFHRAVHVARAFAFLALVGVCLQTGVVRAQEANPPRGYVARREPDVQVVVAPLPTGQWDVTEVYPGRVAHAEVRRRFVDLLKRTGWSVSDVTYEDRGFRNHAGGKPNNAAGDGDDSPNPVMSSVTFLTPAQIVDLTGGTIDVSPFALAFRDLTHVNLVFLVPANMKFQFRGLRNFSDDRISMDLIGGQGTYTYLMNIKDHQMNALALPRYQPATVAVVRANGFAARARALQTGLIIVLAAAVGVIVYLWATRLTSGSASTGGSV